MLLDKLDWSTCSDGSLQNQQPKNELNIQHASSYDAGRVCFFRKGRTKHIRKKSVSILKASSYG